MDLEDATRRLYAMPLDQFMGTRTGLVADARAAKDRELATTLAALRKPTVAAWLVNQVVRLDPGALRALVDVGERLHRAQAQMDGAALRSLGRERSGVVDALVRRASELGKELGTAASDAVAGELRETFTAAAMSAEASAAVRSGRLVRALSYAGFGDVDVSDAVALAPPAPRPPAPPEETNLRAASVPGGVGSAGGATTSETPAASARSAPVEPGPNPEALAAAKREVELGRAELDRLTERARRAEDEVNDLEERLDQARGALVALVTETGRARRALREAERALEGVRAQDS